MNSERRKDVEFFPEKWESEVAASHQLSSRVSSDDLSQFIRTAQLLIEISCLGVDLTPKLAFKMPSID
jgi:hypothetical protein